MKKDNRKWVAVQISPRQIFLRCVGISDSFYLSLEAFYNRIDSGSLVRIGV